MKRRLPLPECLEPASCDLPALLKRLSLPTIRRLLDDTERIAVDHQMGHREFLAHLVVAEVRSWARSWTRTSWRVHRPLTDDSGQRTICDSTKPARLGRLLSS
jgi:hypothetical protein